MATVKRYKISKDQLERVVENFVMEAASIESKKAPVKNHIPSQGAEAKKHIKNKMSGKMVEKGEGVPTAGKLQKKLPQASDAKKHMSSAKTTHSNKARVVKENEVIMETSPEEWREKAKEMIDPKQKLRKGTPGRKAIADLLVAAWKKDGKGAFGGWAKQYFEGKKDNDALKAIWDAMIESYIESYVKNEGAALKFDFSTGEWKPRASTTDMTNISLGR